jgi:tetratricopeptide (TPR) repeat protein
MSKKLIAVVGAISLIAIAAIAYVVYSRNTKPDSETIISPENRDKIRLATFQKQLYVSQDAMYSGQSAEAEPAVKEMLANASSSLEKVIANYWLGMMYYDKKDAEKAENAFRAAVSVNPEDAIAPTAMLAVLMNDKGNYSEGLEYAERTLELNSSYVLAINEKGVALVGTGKKEEGISYIKKAISLTTDNSGYKKDLEWALTR